MPLLQRHRPRSPKQRQRLPRLPRQEKNVDHIREVIPVSKVLLRFDEVEVMLGCSKRHIYDLLKAGKIRAQNPRSAPGTRGTKIVAESVDEYLRATEIPAEKWGE
jgi:excisionase family DNA binding protein